MPVRDSSAFDMTTDSAQRLVSEAIEAHGGAERWNGLVGIEVNLSAWGFLFTAKRRPTLTRARVWASTRAPHIVLHDVPRPGQRSELLGEDEVRIVDAVGRTLDSRRSPRAAFRSLRRQLYWDALDFAYFGGYATWNYLTTPFLFLRPGFRFALLPPLQTGADKLERLEVVFPRDVPTHCPTQVFYFDSQRRLRRLDYRAEVVGGWANAAHLCASYRNFEGIEMPTSRRVRPRSFTGAPLPFPTLVAIEIHHVVLERA